MAEASRFHTYLERSTVLRYALAPVCVGIATLLHIATIGPLPAWSSFPPPIHPTTLFQVSVVAAAWFGGTGPGLLAAVLATLTLPLLITMNYPLVAGFFDLPRFLGFGITGVAVGWGITFARRARAALRQSELELRKGRDELESRVLARTAELRRSQALLAEAERLSRTGSFSWKSPTDAVAWSEETFRIFGYDRASKPTVELVLQRVHPRDVTLVKEAIERALRERHDFERECRLLMPDGSVKHVQLVARAVSDGSDGVELVGAVMDVTERRQAEEALRKAQEELAHVARVMMMGELAASIAHEINQPLAAIVAEGDACQRWLAASPPKLDEARESVSCIIRDGSRASDIIKRIRALVRKGGAQKMEFDVNDAIRAVMALAEGDARRNGVTLRVDLAEDPLPVIGDRIQLQQVILNLVVNGVEATSSVTDRAREVQIRSRRHESDQALVLVLDSGIGIEPGTLDRIFDTFYTTKPQGMGMGLAISRSIVENHGGKLQAIPNDGPGMRFELTLPAETARATSRRPAAG
jgi:PAS domain S-box-containing protein